MKRDETQAYAPDIRGQRMARKIRPMNTQTFTLNRPTACLPQSRLWFTAFGALLLCAGAVQAAEPQTTATERPLDLAVPHDATVLQAWRKPYGSGYEARGLGERNKSAADATLVPSNPPAGNGHAGGAGGGSGSGGSGAGGSSGGSGGSGGRGR